MKKFAMAFSIGIIVCCNTFGQTKTPAIDKSPMDMSYYPPNYPILKIQDKITEPLAARVVYSRPQRNGRTVFGELVDYGSVWRLGANEATEIEFFRDMLIAGKALAKGRYTMYAIPRTDKWTIIFNSDTDTWGSFRYDAKKDVLRVEVPVQNISDPVDPFSIYFEKTTSGFDFTAAWENTVISVPMKVVEKAAIKPPAKPVPKK